MALGKQGLKKAVPPFLRKRGNSKEGNNSSNSDTSPSRQQTGAPDWRKYLIPTAGERKSSVDSSGAHQSTFRRQKSSPEQQNGSSRRPYTSANTTDDVTTSDALRKDELSPSEWLDKRKRFVRSKTNPEILSMSTSKVNEMAAAAAANSSAYGRDRSNSRGTRRASNIADGYEDSKVPINSSDRRSRYRRKADRSSTVEPIDASRLEITLGGAAAGNELTSSNAAGKPFFRVFTQPKIDYLAKGRCIKMFGKKGAKQDEFNWPRGVAMVSGSDDIVVCDSSNHRYQFTLYAFFIFTVFIACLFFYRASVFNIKGQFQRSFGKYGNGKGEFDCLAGVATNKFRQFVITDRCDSVFKKLSVSFLF